MSPLPTNPRGMYFEEFEAGQHVVTAGRTITEGDIVSFAGCRVILIRSIRTQSIANPLSRGSV